MSITNSLKAMYYNLFSTSYYQIFMVQHGEILKEVITPNNGEKLIIQKNRKYIAPMTRNDSFHRGIKTIVYYDINDAMCLNSNTLNDEIINLTPQILDPLVLQTLLEEDTIKNLVKIEKSGFDLNLNKLLPMAIIIVVIIAFIQHGGIV